MATGCLVDSARMFRNYSICKTFNVI